MPIIYPAGSKVIRLGRERRGVTITPAAITGGGGGVSIPVGLSGVGVFSDDFTGYTDNTTLRASSQLSFANSATYGGYDGSTLYNSHATVKNKLLTDGSQLGIGTLSSVPWSVSNATYRATVKWAAGTTVPSGGTHDLICIYPKDMTATGYGVNERIVRFYIKDIGSGVLHYMLDTVLTTYGGSGVTSALTSDLGAVGAELTAGYTVEYLLRLAHPDSTHFVVTVWLAKNTGSPLTTAMRLAAPVSRSMGSPDATLYQGKYNPIGLGAQSTPAAEVDTWLAQFEIVDETAHPDVYGLASASATYTPLA